MDLLCTTCNTVSHDGTGACRFCGTPFPPIEDEPLGVDVAETEGLPPTSDEDID